MRCLQRDFDDEGRMFFCELERGHRGPHHRDTKTGYRRPYLVVGGEKMTFHRHARSK